MKKKRLTLNEARPHFWGCASGQRFRTVIDS